MTRPKCYVCGSREIAPDADLRSPTCEGCKPARQHVVSNQTAMDGGSLAICPCGWRSHVAPIKGRYAIQDVRVRLHWRDVIRRSQLFRTVAGAIEEYAIVFGKTTAQVVHETVDGALVLLLGFVGIGLLMTMGGA